MDVRWKNGAALLTGMEFDARLCLIDSAQSFAWREHEGKYYAVLVEEALSVEPIEHGIRLYPVNEAELDRYIHYFDLLRDYGSLGGKVSGHPRAVQALAMLPGLRILNQPAWDALLSFILSANNNVARIRKLCWLLGEHFGERRGLDGLVLHALPSPEVLAEVDEQALRALGFGYRAPFLIRTAKMVAAGFPLDSLCSMPYERAHELLLQLPGVGDKVADCVLLFGCGHASAFPVDVWVARLVQAWFPELRGLSKLKLMREARALLGDQAGLIQQFLFHCARCGLIPLDEDALDSQNRKG